MCTAVRTALQQGSPSIQGQKDAHWGKIDEALGNPVGSSAQSWTLRKAYAECILVLLLCKTRGLVTLKY